MCPVVPAVVEGAGGGPLWKVEAFGRQSRRSAWGAGWSEVEGLGQHFSLGSARGTGTGAVLPSTYVRSVQRGSGTGMGEGAGEGSGPYNETY